MSSARKEGQPNGGKKDRPRVLLRGKPVETQNAGDNPEGSVEVKVVTASPRSVSKAVHKPEVLRPVAQDDSDEEESPLEATGELSQQFLTEADFGIQQRPGRSEYPGKKIEPWQAGIQYTQRFLDALAFGSGMGPHTLGPSLKSHPDLEIMMMSVGIPANDILGEECLVPMALKKKPFAEVTAKGAGSQFISLLVTAGVGYTAGLVLGEPFKNWISTYNGVAKFGRIMGCSIGLGLAGSVLKAAIVTSFDPKRRDLLKAEQKDDPKELHISQHGLHLALGATAAFAWKEPIRTGLMEAGYASVANHCIFTTLTLCGADMIRHSMLYLGHTPDPFAKLVPSSPVRAENSALDAVSDIDESDMRSPSFNTLTAEVDLLPQEGNDDDLLATAIPDAAPSTPAGPTKKQIAKVIGTQFAICATSTGILLLANYLFVTYGEKYNKADRDPNLPDNDPFVIRLGLDCARYVAYRALNEGIPRLASAALSRFSNWRQSRATGSASVQSALVPTFDPTSEVGRVDREIKNIL